MTIVAATILILIGVNIVLFLVYAAIRIVQEIKELFE